MTSSWLLRRLLLNFIDYIRVKSNFYSFNQLIKSDIWLAYLLGFWWLIHLIQTWWCHWLTRGSLSNSRSSSVFFQWLKLWPLMATRMRDVMVLTLQRHFLCCPHVNAVTVRGIKAAVSLSLLSFGLHLSLLTPYHSSVSLHTQGGLRVSHPDHY